MLYTEFKANSLSFSCAKHTQTQMYSVYKAPTQTQYIQILGLTYTGNGHISVHRADTAIRIFTWLCNASSRILSTDGKQSKMNGAVFYRYLTSIDMMKGTLNSVTVWLGPLGEKRYVEEAETRTKKRVDKENLRVITSKISTP